MKVIYGVIIAILIVVSGFMYLEMADSDQTIVDIKEVVTTSASFEEDVVEKMIVHVTGAVLEPGVYEVAKGIRLYELIEQAGGFSLDADQDYLNLAREVFDGEQLHVPSQMELLDEHQVEGTYGKVNINKDDKEALMTLTGIGETKAAAIILYREANGPFKKIEDIMEVAGIKEAMFQKIKNDIVI